VDTRAGVGNRNHSIEDIVVRTGIDEAMIERLVRTFYRRARLDPVIGPIFENNCVTGNDILAACVPSGRLSR
jgi:truncated hemoglobin YjbI